MSSPIKDCKKVTSPAKAQPFATVDVKPHDDGFAKVTGDFNENGDIVNPDVMKSLGLCLDAGGVKDVGGNDNEDGRNGKTIFKGKLQNKPEYSVFKYSSRFRGSLHEAVLLRGEPVFLTHANGQLQTVKRIEEVNRILRPPSIEEYPYEPYEFNSLEEIRAYGDKARTETIDTLYHTIKSVVKLYIDQDEENTILMSADISWTYFQDLFPTTHYYDVTGRANGIGKSTIGHVFEGIAYRAVNLTDPSAANLYRILGPIEAGQCIIIADEADKIHNSSELLSILKTGYTQLGRVSKVNMNTLKQEFFYSYCFKIRIGEESLRTSVAAGVVDRSFQFKPVKGKPLYDIKEVLQPAIRNASLGKLQNDLRSLRKLLLVYRLVHFNDLIAVDIDIGLEGRDKELCKPLLQLFHGTKAYPKVKSSLESFLNKKNKRKKNTVIDSVLYEIIVNLVSSKGDKIYNAEIWQAIRDKIQGHWDDKKPGVYETYDYDTIYRTTIIKIVEGFGAEHDRDHVGRFLKFDLTLLAKAARQFDIDVSIQDKLDNILAANKTSNVFNFDCLDVTSSQPKNDVNITGNEEANKEIAKKLAENNNKNLRDGVTGTVAITVGNSKENESTIYRIGNTECFGCQGCSVRGDKWAMEEHVCTRSKTRNGKRGNK
jgi:hypothetical protein